MSDLTVSSAVDTFMQATNAEGMRTAIEIANIVDHADGVTVSGELIVGTSEPIYEDSGSIRIGTANRSILGSAFIVTREHTADSNAHGIDENSTINPSGAARSYAAFCARGQLTATQDMGHYNGFQFDPTKSGSGDLDEFGAVTSSATVSAGTVGQLHHFSVTDASVSGTGAVTDQYGVLIQGLTAATNNWAIYCLAPTKSYHGGDIAVAGSARTPVASVDIAGTLKAGGATVYQVIVGRPFSGSEGGIYIQSAGTYGEMQAMQEGVGYFPFVLQRRGGNVLMGTTTDNGLKLQVSGAMSLSPGASVTPSANGELVFEATNNTTVTVKLKGSDGTVRSGTITLS